MLSCSYPAQENVGGDAKVPTVSYYDRGGSVRAVGAEAGQEGNIELAREQDWVKAAWYRSCTYHVLLTYVSCQVQATPPSAGCRLSRPSTSAPSTAE
jgi:hypothetical protein